MSSVSPCLRKNPAFCPSSGAAFSQLPRCPIASLSVSSATALPAVTMAAASAQQTDRASFMRFSIGWGRSDIIVSNLPCKPAITCRETGGTAQHRSVCSGDHLDTSGGSARARFGFPQRDRRARGIGEYAEAPIPLTSLTSFITLAPSDFAFFVAAATSSTST